MLMVSSLQTMRRVAGRIVPGGAVRLFAALEGRAWCPGPRRRLCRPGRRPGRRVVAVRWHVGRSVGR